jgi:endonuclease/exonuclease/phosphatase family metal-dependent hydrolase
MTVNVAHGRGTAASQILLGGERIRGNLDAVAAVIGRARPHVVALQEADGPSVWSGDFDHVAYLARAANIPYTVRSAHVDGLRLSYGTALLSQLPMSGAKCYTYSPSPLTFSKGFIVATVDLPGTPATRVDIVSLHLDFLRRSVRRRQIDDTIELLAGRGNELVILGDLNSEWSSNGSMVRQLTTALELRVYQPESEDLGTFGELDRRLDWVLVSDGLKFHEYRVLPDAVSDHYAVVAGIGVRAAEQVFPDGDRRHSLELGLNSHRGNGFADMPSVPVDVAEL